MQMEHDAPSDIVIPFEDFTKFTANLKELLKGADNKPELQTAIVRKLVNRIEITAKGFEIEFFVGKERLSRELGAAAPSLLDFRQSEATENFFSIGGSRRLTNGGGGPTTDAPPVTPAISHNIIRFYPKTKKRIFDVCAPLYEQGFSLREIERQTGFAKSSIRETLTDRGLPLRAFGKDQGERPLNPECMRSGAIPFGYAYLDGKLTVDPREYSVIRKIQKLWQSGKAQRAIAQLLNDQKIPTRHGKRWSHGVVGTILKRHPNKK